MKWQDDAVVLSVRPYGETAAIVQLLTRLQGRHAGLVSGGQGARLRGVYQAGNRLAANWSGRLPAHLTTLEIVRVTSSDDLVIEDSDSLAALSDAPAVCHRRTPEREHHSPTQRTEVPGCDNA